MEIVRKWWKVMPQENVLLVMWKRVGLMLQEFVNNAKVVY